MRVRSKLVSLAAVVVAALPLGSCDLFGQIACATDSDCPDAQPFCLDGHCSETDANGRTGRGVGEGEGEGEGGGACTGDGECGTGLCYDVTDSTGLLGTCVPTADDDASCAEISILGGPDRASGGSVIFRGSVTRAGGDCTPGTQNLQVQLLFLDREGDVDLSLTKAFVMAPGGTSPASGGGSIASDGTSGDGFFFITECFDDTVDHVAIRIGTDAPTSNTLCVPITAAP